MADTSANLVMPNLVQAYASGIGYVIDAQVGALEEIYQGAFTSLDTSDKYLGNMAEPDAFYGIALDRVTGTASNGGVTCRVLCEAVFQKALASVAVADIGKPVFASDNQTLTLTGQGTNTPIGILVGVPATGTAIVKAHPPRPELRDFAVTNWVSDVTLDANGTAQTDLQDFVGTVVKELIDLGILNGTVAT